MSEKALELLREAADAAVALDPDTVPVGDLAEVIEAADRQVQRVRGAIAGWTGALERRGGLADAGFRDASHFLKDRLRQSHGEAKKTAKIAGRLEQLDDTKQALDDGQITFDQAATIAETAEQLARDTLLTDEDPATVVSDAQKTLLHRARTADAGRLRKEGRRLVDRYSTRTAQRDAVLAHPSTRSPPDQSRVGCCAAAPPSPPRPCKGWCASTGSSFSSRTRPGSRCGSAAPSAWQPRPNVWH